MDALGPPPSEQLPANPADGPKDQLSQMQGSFDSTSLGTEISFAYNETLDYDMLLEDEESYGDELEVPPLMLRVHSGLWRICLTAGPGK